MRQRVLYLLRRYPQLSETYIETEIRAVAGRHSVKILTQGVPDLPAAEHHPYQRIGPGEDVAMLRAVKEFEPTVLHGHYAHHAAEVRRIARMTGIPFTIRTHSYDVLARPEAVPDAVAAFNDDLCLGVLTFPFTVDRLTAAGVGPEKLVPCYPVVDVQRFADRAPNGDAIINVGACLPKKNHEFYLDVAARMPHRTFTLYPMGYESERIRQHNEAQGRPVVVREALPHSRMPAEYKRHEWLVYTASPQLRTVGWPMAVAEAQAAGVGVCMQNIRPDLAEYVGPGFLFHGLDDLTEILVRPFPDDLREQGFVHAQRSSITGHLTRLEALWATA